MSRKQARHLLGDVHTSTLWRWEKAGILQPVRVNRNSQSPLCFIAWPTFNASLGVLVVEIELMSEHGEFVVFEITKGKEGDSKIGGQTIQYSSMFG